MMRCSWLPALAVMILIVGAIVLTLLVNWIWPGTQLP